MPPQITVTASGDASYVGKVAKELDGDQLYIGIPEKTTRRKQKIIGPLTQQKTVTNAGLLYIHTNGSLKWNIPARPVIEPSIMANKVPIENMLHQAATELFNGNKAKSTVWLKNCGQFAANGAKRWFEDPRNGWPQDSPETIRRKVGKLRSKQNWMTVRHKEYLKSETIRRLVNQYRPAYGSTPLDTINTPLVDTAQLRRAITWVPKYYMSATGTTAKQRTVKFIGPTLQSGATVSGGGTP